MCIASQGGVGETRLKNAQLKLNGQLRKLNFLKDCLQEHVLPPSAPKQLTDGPVPFKRSAREWLKENIKTQELDLEIDKFNIKALHKDGVRLPHRIHTELKKIDEKERKRLERKLQRCINKSKWRTAGREDLITNLSSRRLTEVEKEALSLGAKFDTGVRKNDLADLLIKNHRWKDSSTDQGMMQGLSLAAHISALEQPSTLPRRYTKALKDLNKDESIELTSADKGGGIVILNKTDYVDKMNSLLTDDNTYRKVSKGTAQRKADVFNKVVRALLRDGEDGKQLLHLLQQQPRTPSMRGLPKIHKAGVPLRPVTNSTESAAHELARELSGPLTKALGSISGCHLWNTSDLINRLKDKGLRNKKLIGLDVVSLYTRVPVDEALAAAKRVLDTIPETDLPIEADIFMKLVEMCVRFGCFEFNDEEYEQIDGLPMGSPLSGVLANLFMETLEEEHYLGIVGAHAIWVRYADDVTILIAVRVDTEELLNRINSVHPRIQFTLEEERDNQLPVLDVLIMRDENHRPKFSVYRKPTHKDDYIHFFSAHSEKIKSGAIIGLFLRALRICSPEYLEEEFGTIITAFKRLQYPEGMLLRLREKARVIRQRGSRERKRDTRPLLVIPHSTLTEQLEKHLGEIIKIATPAQTRIGEMIKTKRATHRPENSIIYKIPCGDQLCEKAYYGQTYRGLNKRLSEHKASFRNGNPENPFLLHAHATDHVPHWAGATVGHAGIPTKRKRLFLESATIRSNPNMNSAKRQVGDFNLSKITAHLVATPRQQR